MGVNGPLQSPRPKAPINRKLLALRRVVDIATARHSSPVGYVLNKTYACASFRVVFRLSGCIIDIIKVNPAFRTSDFTYLFICHWTNRSPSDHLLVLFSATQQAPQGHRSVRPVLGELRPLGSQLALPSFYPVSPN